MSTPDQQATGEGVTAANDDAQPREILDTEQAAGYLGVSRQLLELLRVSGGGPRYAKLGRLVRYRKQALDEWVSKNERDNTSAS